MFVGALVAADVGASAPPNARAIGVTAAPTAHANANFDASAQFITALAMTHNTVLTDEPNSQRQQLLQ